MFLEQFVIITWNGKNKQYYMSKGYKFTKTFDKLAQYNAKC